MFTFAGDLVHFLVAVRSPSSLTGVSAFTFSLFEIPPQYLAQNRMLREQGMQRRSLKKPKKIMMKFATKPKVMAAMRRPVKPFK